MFLGTCMHKCGSGVRKTSNYMTFTFHDKRNGSTLTVIAFV